MSEEFNRDEVLRHVGRMEQLASIRRYSIEDGKGRGMRALEVCNGSGFDFTVYPDRGLDIGPARYNGRSLVWLTRNGPVSPAFYDKSSIEWLRSWMGGLLTTCGWLNVGGPCSTAEGEHGLHGRFDHTPAEEVNTSCRWEGDVYVLEVTGKTIHSRVFAENLVTSRTIRTRLGHPGLEIIDSTENLGPSTMPFMQLYHMNFGWPLIGEKTKLVAPEHPISPRDEAAKAGIAEWNTMPPPTAGFSEQVIYHDLPADEDGFCAMDILNPYFGAKVTLSFRKRELPYLVQWRQAGVGDYVMGLEPANCHPIGQIDFAKAGKLRHIEPGEVVKTVLRVGIT